MNRDGVVRGLPSLGALLRHQIASILASVLLAVGMAWIYVYNLPLTYTATAIVLLSPAPGNPLTPETASGSVVQMTVALETEAQLIRTPAVADVVGAIAGWEIPGPGEKLSVSIPSNTQMLEISFTSDTPETAQQGAQAFAEGYLNYREERARSLQESRVERLNEQIEEADANLQRATGEASADDASAYASQEVQLFADRLAQLNNSLSDALALGTFPGSVIDVAELPEHSNELPGWLILAAGGGLGLVAGLGVAFLREWRRDLLRDADAAALMGVPVLASIRSTATTKLASDADPAVHESYRQLRTAVIATGERPHILAVTEVSNEAVTGGVGHSAEVAANLAVVLAEARFSVLLISTSSQEFKIEDLFGIDPAEGLAEAARSEVSASDLLIRTRDISLLTAGLDTAGSRDLTASTAFREIVDELHPQFDYVILSASTAGSADGDAALLAAHSSLLVLAPDAITRTLLGATLDRLDRLGVTTDGAVMLSQPKRRKNSSVEVQGVAEDDTEGNP